MSSGSAEEALTQAVAMEQYNSGPNTPPVPEPPPDQNYRYIRVDSHVDLVYPPQVQYLWDTSKISGPEYQQFYGNIPQVGSGGNGAGGGPFVGQYHAVQGADGRVYWAQANPA